MIHPALLWSLGIVQKETGWADAGRVRFWTDKSSKKSAFFRTKKSAFAKKSALESAFFSAKKVFSYKKG